MLKKHIPTLYRHQIDDPENKEYHTIFNTPHSTLLESTEPEKGGFAPLFMFAPILSILHPYYFFIVDTKGFAQILPIFCGFALKVHFDLKI